MSQIIKFLMLLFSLSILGLINYGSCEVLNSQLYEDVKNPELCKEELMYIEANPLLRANFLDAGIRIPRGVLDGNFVDLGNYFQCLSIKQDAGNSIIEGKYCSIRVAVQQNEEFIAIAKEAGLNWPSEIVGDEDVKVTRHRYNELVSSAEIMSGSMVNNNRSLEVMPQDLTLTLAVCIPKTCTTNEALDSLLFNATTLGFKFTEDYCRLPNDKPYAGADYAAFAIFGLLAVITIVSTLYDVNHSIWKARDPKTANPYCVLFSMYTNGKQIVKISKNPKTIQCMDGIRVIAMLWVMYGHTFSSQMQYRLTNPAHMIKWLSSFKSVTVTGAPMTVDTFLMMSGLLLVYTNTGRLTGMSLLKQLHKFYINRYLRMFPILAAGVLLTASWFNHVGDGPYWQPMEKYVEICRTDWWATILLIQNYYGNLRNGQTCLNLTWYLAVDFQLHLISPVVLFFVLNSKRAAWRSLVLGMLASLAIVSALVIIDDFPVAPMNAGGRPVDRGSYMGNYYVNTLTRSPPFFVGMIYGYILHLGTQTKFRLNRLFVAFMWYLSMSILIFIMYITYATQKASWYNPALDDAINILMRSAWVFAVGWIILACAWGYGGPINYVLSLRLWKVPAKISYAMYIFHYPLMLIVNGTELTTVYFKDDLFLFRFFGFLSITVLVAFFATLLIDMPFAEITNMLIRGGSKKPSRPDTRQKQIPEEPTDVKIVEKL